MIGVGPVNQARACRVWLRAPTRNLSNQNIQEMDAKWD